MKIYKKYSKDIRNIIIILFGSLLFAIGINAFAIPNHIGEGGFTGIALLLYYFLNWPPSIVIFALNIPLMLIGYKIFGKKTFYYTLLGISSVAIFLHLTKKIAYPSDDILLMSLYTGVMVGTGLGMIFRVGGTTGGVDIIARLANKFFGFSIGKTMFLVDFLVIISSIFVIGLNMAMYTLVALFIGTRVIDYVVEGLNISKTATIISYVPQDLAKIITQEMNRGVTILEGKGGYTGEKKEILYVVLEPNELIKLKEVVNKIDKKAFIIVHDTKDVMGKGFTF